MPALADLQAGVRRAVVHGDLSVVAPFLIGGGDPRKRLAIHHRHYAASLVTTLLNRFPATVWLVGSPLVREAARAFIEAHPPSAPCIAEYGDRFPSFLAARPGAAPLAYLGQFAELEWHLGRLALAVERPPVTDLSAVDSAGLADMRLEIQPGAHYLRLDWGLDELMALYLSDSEPERFRLATGDTWLELRGVRGRLQMNRLTCAEHAFRAAVAQGEPLGDAATAALEILPAFDAGRAFAALLAEGLVTGMGSIPDRENS